MESYQISKPIEIIANGRPIGIISTLEFTVLGKNNILIDELDLIRSTELEFIFNETKQEIDISTIEKDYTLDVIITNWNPKKATIDGKILEIH